MFLLCDIKQIFLHLVLLEIKILQGCEQTFQTIAENFNFDTTYGYLTVTIPKIMLMLKIKSHIIM